MMKRRAMPAGRQAFTLVELIIVVAILAMMVVMFTGIFNSVGVFNRARDTRRKKDVARIRVAFEEYYNDKGCYPGQNRVADLIEKSNCGSRFVFSPWLSPWPCDPGGEPYMIATNAYGEDDCATWYKILANLENLDDDQIPDGWYEETNSELSLGGEYTTRQANYGVSSSNVVWSDARMDPECEAYGGCYYIPSGIVCNAIGSGCIGPNCYLGLCQPSCRVACCGDRCD